jgi:hypothetical protein
MAGAKQLVPVELIDAAPTSGGLRVELANGRCVEFITRFSLPYSRCKTWPVRNTPCSRAASAAALHNASGKGDLPCRVLRHRSSF